MPDSNRLLRKHSGILDGPHRRWRSGPAFVSAARHGTMIPGQNEPQIRAPIQCAPSGVLMRVRKNNSQLLSRCVRRKLWDNIPHIRCSAAREQLPTILFLIHSGQLTMRGSPDAKDSLGYFEHSRKSGRQDGLPRTNHIATNSLTSIYSSPILIQNCATSNCACDASRQRGAPGEHCTLILRSNHCPPAG